MGFSDAHARGFALAAILQDERDLGWARAHVDDHLLQRALEDVRAVRDAADRREALARLVRAVHGERDLGLLPASMATRLSERAKADSGDAHDDVLALLSRLSRRGAAT